MSLITRVLLLATVFAVTHLNATEPLDREHSEESDKGFNANKVILDHVGDSHEIHLWGEGDTSFSIPLPVILYTEGDFDIFMSSNFHHGKSNVIKGNREYKYHHGHIQEVNGKSVIDLSITKNVVGLLLASIILIIVFGTMAKSYTKEGIPKGVSRFLEPFVIFVRDDIAKANIGEKKYKKFMPYLLTAFFLIWLLNLLGLLPFGFNVTGNIAFTFVLALFTLILTVFNGNKDYWKHIFATPGVPSWLSPIMIPVELIGILTKPFALMMRLFANITAGHIVILSLISIIFIMKNVGMAGMSVPFALFISMLELLVAFLQAFIFTMLSALFIGMAVEEHEHH
ncbi:MAG: F0F1 ATP synthase subunit A [Flavobacteriales bacterium]